VVGSVGGGEWRQRLLLMNLHEYIVFDRAKIDPALPMRWPAFEKAYPGWVWWGSVREFLVEWGLDDESQIEMVDEILARKTVGATLRLAHDPFHFLMMLLDEKGLTECIVPIGIGDYSYGDEIVACAGAAFVRGALSLASLTAVYHLHANRVDPEVVLLPDVAIAVLEQPEPPPMLPGMPNILPSDADGLGVSQARRFIDFLLRAWREKWPLRAKGQAPRAGETIRCCEVAGDLVEALRERRLAKPCMFR
jgi:hypothetical protein